MHDEDGKYPFEVFRNEEKEQLRIVDMRQFDAERDGIDRKTRWRMKKISVITSFLIVIYIE